MANIRFLVIFDGKLPHIELNVYTSFLNEGRVENKGMLYPPPSTTHSPRPAPPPTPPAQISTPAHPRLPPHHHRRDPDTLRRAAIRRAGFTPPLRAHAPGITSRCDGGVNPALPHHPPHRSGLAPTPRTSPAPGPDPGPPLPPRRAAANRGPGSRPGRDDLARSMRPARPVNPALPHRTVCDHSMHHGNTHAETTPRTRPQPRLSPGPPPPYLTPHDRPYPLRQHLRPPAPAFFHRQPRPRDGARLIAVNGPLARDLGLDTEALASPPRP